MVIVLESKVMPKNSNQVVGGTNLSGEVSTLSSSSRVDSAW